MVDTSIPTTVYTEDEKDSIMVMIQTKEIKISQKNIHATAENHQNIWDNMEKMIFGITD